MHVRTALPWLLRTMPGWSMKHDRVLGVHHQWPPLNGRAWRQTAATHDAGTGSWHATAWQQTWRHIAVPRYGDAIRVAEAHEKSRRSHVNVDACIAETAHEKWSPFQVGVLARSLAFSCRPDLDLLRTTYMQFPWATCLYSWFLRPHRLNSFALLGSVLLNSNYMSRWTTDNSSRITPGRFQKQRMKQKKYICCSCSGHNRKEATEGFKHEG